MVSVRPIRSEEDYEEALARIGDLLDELSVAEEQIEDPDHPSMIELEVLSDLVEVYESKTVDMGFPSAIEAIEFRMDQAGSHAPRPGAFHRQLRQGLRGALWQEAHHNVDGSRSPPPSWHTCRRAAARAGRKHPGRHT